MINHPYLMVYICLYNPFMVIRGMVYCCYTHIIYKIRQNHIDTASSPVRFGNFTVGMVLFKKQEVTLKYGVCIIIISHNQNTQYDIVI